MIEITPALIEKFFANKCDAEDSVRIAEYLSKTPGDVEICLKKIWEEAGEKSSEAEVPCQKEMLSVIRSAIGVRQQARTTAMIKWIAIAACLLIIVGIWSVPGTKTVSKEHNSDIAANELSAKTEEKWAIRANETDDTIAIEMTEGSMVELAPKSRISYSESFGLRDREIRLEGDALFKVAKDQSRPFTVHSDHFSTTALGTIFRVEDDGRQCTVKLYEGKVVIKAKGQADTYLLSGQQLVYDDDAKNMTLSNFQSLLLKKLSAKKGNDLKRKLDFQNEHLVMVLNRLADYFDQSIIYDKSEIDDLYFSGTVLAHDSLQVILNVIAQMNSLAVTKQGDGYLIKKSY